MSYLIETHFHTSETSPCGQVQARDGIRQYKHRGYDAVVVTDHFQVNWFERQGSLTWPQQIDRWLAGYKNAKKAGEEFGVRVILGMEYTFPGTADDILIFGLTEQKILSHPCMHRLGPAGLARLAKEEKLLLIQAHPFRPYITQVYDSLIEGLEVYNGNPRHDSDDCRAEMLAEKQGWVAISGSDFHQPQDCARGGIRLPELPSDTLELAAMLQKIRKPELVKSREATCDQRLGRSS